MALTDREPMEPADGIDRTIHEPARFIDRTIHEPARYLIMSWLYVVENADALFIQKQTGLTWGNLSSHLGKLETAGYVAITKEFLGRKPHTMLQLTKDGRAAFESYRVTMKRALEDLPGG